MSSSGQLNYHQSIIKNKQARIWMAYLLQKGKERPLFLKAFHRIGSLKSSVDTHIDSPTVSRVHAILLWKSNNWFIRDTSKNGIILNGTKAAINQDLLIKNGDEIILPGHQQNRFMVADDAPPCDMLIPRIDSNDAHQNDLPDALFLSGYHLLPNEVHPQAILYKSPTNQWCIEYTDRKTAPLMLNDGEWVYFSGRQWVLQLCQESTDTIELDQPQYRLENLLFRFNLSLDEEATQLQLKTPQQTFDFQIRSHHYLTLNLARHKAMDAQNGIEKTGQGWIYTESLAKELGTEINYLNIMIHRARKQFADVLSQQYLSDHLIERQAGKLRFGGHTFEIYKGSHLEHAVSV